MADGTGKIFPVGARPDTAGDAIYLELTNGAAHVADGALTTQIENAGTYTYIGEATPNQATSAAVWRVSRITNASGTTEYGAVAAGDVHGSFNQVWDDRASLNYG